MSSARRFLALVLSACAVVVFTLPVLATEEPVTDSTVTETTVAGDSGVSSPGAGAVPAVTVPPTADDEVTADWTYRFLIPTLLALAVVVVVATTIQYFMRVVRNRYKVVE
ncbi:MAG TPA: hypothetical protein VK088_05420 [Acidimicrobiia bacterium]|nr:hypothetical protein [Acidimicrobiia bacterium]